MTIFWSAVYILINRIHPKNIYEEGEATDCSELTHHYKMQALKKFIAGKSIPHFPNMQLTSQ